MKWDYKVVYYNDLIKLDTINPLGARTAEIGLNSLGARGWELVAVVDNSGNRYYFKRPG